MITRELIETWVTTPLTFRKLGVLLALAEFSPLTKVEIEEIAHLSERYTDKTLKEFIKKGYAVRARKERSAILTFSITPEGHELLRDLFPKL